MAEGESSLKFTMRIIESSNPCQALADVLLTESRFAIPIDFSTPATFLVASLPRNQPTLAKQIGDMALKCLECRLPRIDESTGSLVADAYLLRQLLFLIEALPLTNPAEGINVLNDLRRIPLLRGWPSQDQDCHRAVLLAMASHANHCPFDPYRWVKELDSDMSDSAYAVAALSVVVEQSLPLALARLPKVLILLQRHKVPTGELLRKFAGRLTQQPNLLKNVDRHTQEAIRKTLAKLAAAHSNNSKTS